jgi:hypothetical protein
MQLSEVWAPCPRAREKRTYLRGNGSTARCGILVETSAGRGYFMGKYRLPEENKANSDLISPTPSLARSVQW